MARVDPAESTAATRPRRRVAPSMIERMTLIMDVFEDRSTRLTLEEVGIRPGCLVRRCTGSWTNSSASNGWSTRRSATASVGGRAASAAASTVRFALQQRRHCTNCTCRRHGRASFRARRGGWRVPGQERRPLRLEPAVACRWSRRRLRDGRWQGDARLARSPAGGRTVRRGPRSSHRQDDHRHRDTASGTEQDSPTRRRGLRAGRVGPRCGMRRCRGPWRRRTGCRNLAVWGCPRLEPRTRRPLVVDAVAEVSRILDPEFGDGRRNRRVTGTRVDTWSADALDRLVSIQTGRWV